MRSLVVAARRTLLVASFLAFLGLSLKAQTNNGAIAGSILDSSGGAIVGAQVTATGVETHSIYNAVSSSTGAYRLSDLVLGSYDITVTAKGFKVAKLTGVVVQINTTAALDITLQPGEVKETVTVEADAPTIQTETSDIGTVINQKQIQQLPLSIAASGQGYIRAVESFIFLTPGTAGPGTNSDHASAGTFETKLAGGQNFGTEIILDGASISRMDTSSAFTQTAPSVEAINEFKVTTASIPAEYGRTSGGVESFATRSGTNSFHGAAFEYFRNDKLDANSWYNNLLGNPKPRDHKNNYGVSLGGPVWIPKIYNGKNKTFFFFSWEQYRENVADQVTSTLPTDAERGGDFSALLGSGPLTPITDPNTNLPLVNPCYTAGADPAIMQYVYAGEIFDPSTTRTVNGSQCRLPFYNSQTGQLNQIPSSSFSNVAQNVLNYVPTLGPSGALAQNNYLFSSTENRLDTAMTIRVDQNLGTDDKLYFSISPRHFESPNGASNFPGPINGNYLNTYQTYYIRAGWDHVLQSNLLNHMNVGLNRIDSKSTSFSVTGVDWNQKLGIGNAFGQAFPTFGFNGPFSYTGWGAGNNDSHYPNSLVLDDSATWIKGRHSFKFGLEWRSYQFSVLSQATSPNYTFSAYQTSYSSNPVTNTTGDGFASLLIGQPQSANLTVYSVYPRWSATYLAGYVMDDYKMRRDFTWNLGFRYDIDTPRTEAHAAQSNLDLNVQNPGTPGQTGALVYGAYANLGNIYFKDFGPRVGFAYAPDVLFGKVRNIVFRGGYSIYYAPLVYSDFGGSFLDGTSASPSFTSANNFTPIQSIDAGFPAYNKPPFFDPAVYNGQSPNYVAPQYGKPGMVQNWTFQIQKQVVPDLILSVGYVGMHSTRLRSSLAQINNLNPRYYNLRGNIPASGGCTAGTYDPTVLNASYDSCAGAAALADLGVTVPSWLPPLYGGSPTLSQVLKPYPQFQNISTDGGLENLGQSTYNAAWVSLDRRFRNGLSLLASYTFSKTLTDADSNYPLFTAFNSGVWAQDSFNLKNNKAVSYQDIPQTFVLSYVYELPLGPGKKFVNKGGAIGKIVGGWQVSGIQRYQSGSPTVINCYAPGIPGNSGNICFDYVPGTPLVNPGAKSIDVGAAIRNGSNFACWQSPFPTNGYFNCAGFGLGNNSAATNGYTFGTIPRTIGNIRSANYLNEDFSIVKNTTIYENYTIQFRADFLNAFNRHSFAALDGNYYDTGFGLPGGGGSGVVVNDPKKIQFSVRFQF